MKLCVNFNRLTENQTRKLISLFETMCIAGDIDALELYWLIAMGTEILDLLFNIM